MIVSETPDTEVLLWLAASNVEKVLLLLPRG
jgi:hypothetical protein